MSELHASQGDALDVNILSRPAVNAFISAHASVLNVSFDGVPMSDAMRSHLQQSDWIFSGLKTFHELNEAFPSLLDSNGERKPFETFLKDVQKIDKTYNRNYLRAEYNYAHSAAKAAAEWERIADPDTSGIYDLQYRTVGDGLVRPEHAALDMTTLPVDDPFWRTYYPPNGWNCRCYVVRVRKGRYPESSSEEALQRGAQATAKDKNGMFHYNPGIQKRTFPDYNPYTISRCRTCDIAKGKISLSRPSIPDNELCKACQYLRECYTVRGKKVTGRREELKTSGELTTIKRNQPTPGVQSGSMLRSLTVLDRFLSHCYNVQELEAAKYIWQHPEELKEPRPSVFGEGKDMNNPKDRKNLAKKKERGVVGYNLYHFSYKGRDWNVKVEVHEKGSADLPGW